MESYVVPTIGKVQLQQLTAPRLQAFYSYLSTQGRMKVDLSAAMDAAWKGGMKKGTEPTARWVAAEAGGSIHTARAAALRRFRAGQVPAAKSPGLEPKTVRNVHVMLHAALSQAVRWRHLVENVAENGKPLRVPHRRPTVWTPAQLREFLTFAREDRFYALFLLAATTELRRAELCGLRWPAVDLDGGALSDYLASERVFTWENGRPVHPDVIRQRFNRLATRCGLPRIRWHDMRHSYAR